MLTYADVCLFSGEVEALVDLRTLLSDSQSLSSFQVLTSALRPHTLVASGRIH
jgi:hypothetical protein